MAERFGDKGWIKLWRKSMRNEFYQNGKPFDEFHAWIDLLLMADSSANLQISANALKQRWNWSSRFKVRAYLDSLCAQKMLKKQPTKRGAQTVYKICNFETLQESKSAKFSANSRTNNDTQEEKRSLKEEKNAIGFSQKESHSSSRKSAKDLVAEWSESNE